MGGSVSAHATGVLRRSHSVLAPEARRTAQASPSDHLRGDDMAAQDERCGRFGCRGPRRPGLLLGMAECFVGDREAVEPTKQNEAT